MAERRRQEQPGWTLASYEYETARYYTMLKCQHASHMEQMRQWELLSKAHYALVGRAGGRAIRNAQTRARMTADAARCY
jgi:transketolase N-terminal domain/subunit